MTELEQEYRSGVLRIFSIWASYKQVPCQFNNTLLKLFSSQILAYAARKILYVD